MVSHHQHRFSAFGPLLPVVAKALGTDQEVFFYEGIAHPVRCEKVEHYKDNDFTCRLLPRVSVQKVKLEPFE